MHIPAADTASLDILSFDEALRQSRCAGCNYHQCCCK